MKYPRNRQGMSRRKNCRKHFNPYTGLPHTKAFLDEQRECGKRRRRRMEVAT